METLAAVTAAAQPVAVEVAVVADLQSMLTTLLITSLAILSVTDKSGDKLTLAPQLAAHSLHHLWVVIQVEAAVAESVAIPAAAAEQSAAVLPTE